MKFKIETKPALEATGLLIGWVALLGVFIAVINWLPLRLMLAVIFALVAALMWTLFYQIRVVRARLKQLREERDKAQA